MIIYIDESGDHNLESTAFDGKYDIFVLGALCIEEEEYTKLSDEFNTFKQSLFGTNEIVIHTAEITRPSKSKNKENLKFNDFEFRKKFYTGVTDILQKYNFELIFCSIKKQDFVIKYGIMQAQDPYLFCIENILNRILWLKKGPYKIYPEKRGNPLDQILELELLKYKTQGTKFHRGAEIIKSIDEFVSKGKEKNLAGQQIIDLLVSPVGRKILGFKEKPIGNEILFNDFSSKIEKKNWTIYP